MQVYMVYFGQDTVEKIRPEQFHFLPSLTVSQAQPCGVARFFSGPPGTGKTQFVAHIAESANLELLYRTHLPRATAFTAKSRAPKFYGASAFHRGVGLDLKRAMPETKL